MPRALHASPRSRASLATSCLQVLGLVGASRLLARAIGERPASLTQAVFDSPATVGATGLADAGLVLLPSLVAIVALALLVACIEEGCFRGLLYGYLAPRLGSALAIAVSALAFGALHPGAAHAAAAAVLGLQLGLVRVRYGLGVAIAAHTANNALAYLVVDAPPIASELAPIGLPDGLPAAVAWLGADTGPAFDGLAATAAAWLGRPTSWLWTSAFAACAWANLLHPASATRSIGRLTTGVARVHGSAPKPPRSDSNGERHERAREREEGLAEYRRWPGDGRPREHPARR